MQNFINQTSRSENKGGQVRFGRQFSSGTMSQTYNEIEQTIAVAAAAYVIDSIQQQSNISKNDQRSEVGEANDPISSSSRRKDTKPISIPQSKKSSGRNSITSSENADTKRKAAVPIKVPEKAIGSAPSVKRTITFPDEQMETSNSFIYRTPSKPDLPSIKPTGPEITPLKDVIKNQTSATRLNDIFPGPPPSHPPQKQKPNIPEAQKADIRASKPDQPQIIKHGPAETLTRNSSGRVTDADTWERMEMAKIRERYDKLNATILEWESKKRTKATNNLRKAEQSELVLKREKGLKKYEQEMEYVKQVVRGAKAQAEERQRNEELKLKEKANIVRATGKVPRKTCFCF